MRIEQHTDRPPSFRLDVPLHNLLTKPTAAAPGLQPMGEPQKFPNPVFPQSPDRTSSTAAPATPPRRTSGSTCRPMRALRTDMIDRLADAGLSTFNIAVDAVDLKPDPHKALAPIRKQFNYLVRKRYGYGYSVHCSSTLNHILGWCYNDQRVIKYFFKQLTHGFQGVKGQM